MHLELPPPLPDELLASAIARGAARLGVRPFRLRRQLFDNPHTTIHPLLTQGLQAISLSLQNRCGWNLSAQRLRDEHTLYLAAAPFLPQKVYDAYAADACFTDGQGGLLCSLRASLFLDPAHTLRACLACQQDDRRRFGESYWHRIHQFPGLKLCPHHAATLHATNVLASIKLLPPLEETRLNDTVQVTKGARTYQLAQAHDIQWLLNKPSTHLDRAKLAHALFSSTDHKSTSTTRISPSQIQAMVRSRLSEDALESTRNGFSSLGWTALIAGKASFGASPYQCSALACAARISLEQLVNSANQVSAADTGPWCCINPNCTEHSIPAIKCRFRIENQKRFGFLCERCLTRYSRLRPLRNNPDGSFGFQIEPSQPRVLSERFFARREAKRQVILRYQSGLRQRPPNFHVDCYWSKWNDTEWFYANKPNRSTHRTKKASKDWRKIDAEWLRAAHNHIPDYVSELKSKTIRRISVSTLIREMQRIRGTYFSYNRTPQTLVFLKKYAETEEAALRRRLQFVLSKLRSSPRHIGFEEFGRLCRWHSTSRPSNLMGLVRHAYNQLSLPS